jgi:hypothetical protein
VADPTTTAELVHLRKGYAGSGLACGITGRVRVTERMMDATCPRCRHDGDPVPRTRALDVEKAHAEALVEDAARPAEQPAEPATTAPAFAERHPHPGDDPVARLHHTIDMFNRRPDDDFAILATSNAYPDGGRPGLTWGDLRAIAAQLTSAEDVERRPGPRNQRRGAYR